jgi:gliding motility-associated-like protein
LGDLTILTANSSLPNCTYLWSTGQATSTISTRPIENETEYEVSVKYGPAQCETIETIIVTALNKPIVTANQDVNICYSDSAQIYVSGDAENYFWKSFPVDADAENSTLTNLTVRPHESTMYFAHGLNDIGCENIDTVIVFVNPLPVAQMSFNPTVVNDLDPTVIFSDETNGSVSRRWLLSDGATSTESIFVHLFELSDTNQSYQINLYVQNDAGCQDSVVNSIRIAKTHYLWAPNAIYVYDPDPRISQFRVYIDNPVEFELQIYNRWGECIYTANNQEKAWNGTHKGEIVPQGSYVWVAKYRYAGKRNEVITDKGTFSLYK